MTKSKAIYLRRIIEKAVGSLDDDTACTVTELYPLWKADRQYDTGDRVRYGGKLYRCLTSHTSQSDWLPDAASSLWVSVSDPSVEYPEWEQPAGAHNAYSYGAKVTHNGKKWVSVLEANTYEPGVYGWEEI